MFCPKCGAVVEEKDAFCIACGNDMRAAKKEPQPAAEAPQTPPPAWEQVPAQAQPAAQQPPQGQPFPPASEGGYPGGAPYDPNAVPQRPRISSWFVPNLVFAIVSVLCCCNPISMILHIIGCVCGKGAESAASAGNMDEAESKVRTARTLFIVGLALAVVSILIGIISFFATSGGWYHDFIEEFMSQMELYY